MNFLILAQSSIFLIEYFQESAAIQSVIFGNNLKSILGDGRICIDLGQGFSNFCKLGPPKADLG